MSSVYGARTYAVNDRTSRRKERSPLFAVSAEPTPCEVPAARHRVEVTSFGWNYRLPSPPVGHVLDVRWLPNPFHDPNFRDLSGLDTRVQRFLLAHQETERWLLAQRFAADATEP